MDLDTDTKLEEQAPFLTVDTNGLEAETSLRSQSRTKDIVLCWYNRIVAILSAGFIISAVMQRPTSNQCIRAMSLWCTWETSNKIRSLADLIQQHQCRKLWN